MIFYDLLRIKICYAIFLNTKKIYILIISNSCVFLISYPQILSWTSYYFLYYFFNFETYFLLLLYDYCNWFAYFQSSSLFYIFVFALLQHLFLNTFCTKWKSLLWSLPCYGSLSAHVSFSFSLWCAYIPKIN